MAFADVIISGDITFDASTSRITYLDTSNWIAEGVALADVVGTLSILDPAGQTWAYGTFASPILDLDGATGLSNVITAPGPIAFPKVSNTTSSTPNNKKHIKGKYVFTVVFQYTPSGATITADIEAEYCATAPDISGEFEYNCLAEPLVIFSENTNHAPPGETAWSITSRTIVLRDTKGNSWTTGAATVNQISTGSNDAWTGVYSAEVTKTITRVVSGVTETCSMVETFYGDFQCLSACEIKCLLEKGYNRTLTSKFNDKCKAEDDFQKAATRVTLASEAQDCGDGDLLADLVKEVRSILNITESCCGGGQPTLITPITGTAAAVTLTAGSYIDVGSAPNYTVAVNAAGTAILDDTVNTVVTDGAGITITGPVQTGSNPPTDTYTIATAAGVPTTEPELISVILRVDFEPAGLPTLSITETNIYDGTTTFVAPASWNLVHVAGAVNEPARIEVNGFLTSAANGDPFVAIVKEVEDDLNQGADNIIIKQYHQDNTGAAHKIRFALNHSIGTYDWFSLKNVPYSFIDIGITFFQKP